MADEKPEPRPQKAAMTPTSLPCLVCDQPVIIVAHEGKFSWTDDGIWLTATGNFGSAVLDDPPDRSGIFMVICDQCLWARRDRTRAVQFNGRSFGWLPENELMSILSPPIRVNRPKHQKEELSGGL